MAPPEDKDDDYQHDSDKEDYDDGHCDEKHLAGFLVCVGHKATHKVGLATVEGGHQLPKRDEVDGGDGLAATLLLLLPLLLGRRCGLAFEQELLLLFNEM